MGLLHIRHSSISSEVQVESRPTDISIIKADGDKPLLRLIRKYLQSRIMIGGLVSQRTEGTPHGSPLSLSLSNIILDEMDKELESRGHKLV